MSMTEIEGECFMQITERGMDLLLIRRHEAVAGEDAFSNLRIINLKIRVTFYSAWAG